MLWRGMFVWLGRRVCGSLRGLRWTVVVTAHVRRPMRGARQGNSPLADQVAASCPRESARLGAPLHVHGLGLS